MVAELNQSTISWMNNYPCKFRPLKLDCRELVTNRDGQCLCWKTIVVNYQILTVLIVAMLIVVLVIYGFKKCTDWSSKTLLNLDHPTEYWITYLPFPHHYGKTATFNSPESNFS